MECTICTYVDVKNVEVKPRLERKQALDITISRVFFACWKVVQKGQRWNPKAMH